MSVKKGLLLGLVAGATVAVVLIIVGLIYPSSSSSDESGYLVLSLLGIAGWPLSSWYPVVYLGSLIGRSLPVLINFTLLGGLFAALAGLARRPG